MAFYLGQKVKIKGDAFEGSKVPADIEARGQVGTLTAEIEGYKDGESLWAWFNGSIQVFPLSHEIEEIKENEHA